MPMIAPLRKAVATYLLNAATSNITSSAWTQVTASVSVAASAVEVFNSTGATLSLSQGASSAETAGLLPYTILLGGSNMIIPLEIKNGKPLTVTSLDLATANTGILVLNLFE